MSSLLVLCLLMLAAFGFVVLTMAVSKLNRRIRTLESAETALEREFTAARARATEVEAAQQFLSRFVRELPGVVHGLLSTPTGRNIPKQLLGAVKRIVEPRRAIIAVRRRAAETDPDRHMFMAVAAVHPEGWLELGHEIRIGTGEVGYAVELQRVMERRDFDNQQPHTRKRLREETTGGFLPDLVAPMVVDQEVVGVVAVEGIARRATDIKDAFRLLAQVGAISVHTAARYSEMKATASIDGLTGIFNKRFLTHRIAEETTRALEESAHASLFMFDVDHFKVYNDQNGHVSGDRLLQSLSRLVQDNLRRDTVFGRYGGEEFLIIFPGLRREQAIAAAENIRKAIAAYAFAHAGAQPLGCISISGGVAECPLDGRNAVGLVRAADEALYRAKRAGRNRVLAHEPVYMGESAPQADYTPEPGTLLSLAMITPPAGVPSLAAALRNPEALAAALEAASPDATIDLRGQTGPSKPAFEKKTDKDEAKSA